MVSRRYQSWVAKRRILCLQCVIFQFLNSRDIITKLPPKESCFCCTLIFPRHFTQILHSGNLFIPLFTSSHLYKFCLSFYLLTNGTRPSCWYFVIFSLLEHLISWPDWPLWLNPQRWCLLQNSRNQGLRQLIWRCQAHSVIFWVEFSL